MKTCSKCRLDKPLSEFVKDNRRADGCGSWCLLCNRTYMNARNLTPEVNMARRAHHAANRADRNAANRARWAEKKGQYKVASDKWREAHRDDLLSDYQRRGQEHRAFLDGLKAGKPCLDCVGVYPPFCMEFDHVRGTKRWALGKMANHRREAVLAELEKCELVCCACHRVRTQARKGASRIPKVRAFREWLSALKATPCKDCGKTLHHPAMDFDHLQDDKVSGISAMWSWSREKVLAEIAKCELVCANCHRVRTMSRKAVIPVMEPGV